MAGLLHPVEHHDRQQGADVERRRGAIETDIGGDARRFCQSVKRLRLRDLVNESAFAENTQKVGFIGAHGISQSICVLVVRVILIEEIGIA